MSKKLSPNEQHEKNLLGYAAYIAKLKATKSKFPLNQFGNVNLSLVAEECGFKRGSFQDENSALATLLAADIKKIGTQVKDVSEEESSLQRLKEKASKEASKLSKELERVTSEVYKLRETVTRLEQENKALSHKLKGKSEAFDSMLDDGRRRFVWE